MHKHTVAKLTTSQIINYIPLRTNKHSTHWKCFKWNFYVFIRSFIYITHQFLVWCAFFKSTQLYLRCTYGLCRTHK